MRKIESITADDIKDYQRAKRQQIVKAFGVEEEKSAKLISKAEFEEQFSKESHEIYSVSSLDKFRKELSKAEGSDALFKEATKGLKSFVVESEGKKAIVFVRKKEIGE